MNREETLLAIRAALDYQLFMLAGTPVTVTTVVTVALIVLATLWISRLLQRAAAKFFKLRGVTDEGTVGVTLRLLHYSVLVTGVSIGLQTAGVNLGALFAAGAVFAIAIGFAMQNIAQNFVSGIILMVERSIKPGDILELDGERVKVVQMGFRATIVRTKDEEDLIVPNSNLVASTVKNFTLRDTLSRLRVVVGVSYSSDMNLVQDTLVFAASELPWRTKKLEPVILLQAFGDSSVNFEVSVWIEDPWVFQARSSDLLFAIWNALKEQQIVIAFPQLDLHVHATDLPAPSLRMPEGS